VLFYGVVSDSTEEAVELFTSREKAEAIVQAWDRDEPDQAGRYGSTRSRFGRGRRTRRKKTLEIASPL
jgi:hypothetical protein